MAEQELREKIVEVISQKQTYGITEEFKTEDLGHGGWQAWTETTKVNNAEIADALIVAGLTFEPMTFRIVENKPYSYTAGELANWKEDQDRIAKLLHRAEVAEKAFDDLADEIYQHDVRPICDKEFFKQARFEQAERELAEERKDEER